MINVVTSFDSVGYEVYGRLFIAEFHKNWGLPLTVVSEDLDVRPPELDQPKDSFIPLNIDSLVKLARDERYKRGSDQNKARAIKFGAKALAIQAALSASAWKGWMIWIDADVTFKGGCPTPAWFDRVLRPHCSVACLYRPEHDVETGFVAYKIEQPEPRSLIGAVAGMYETGKVLDLQNWQDGTVFKHQLYLNVPVHQVYNIAHDVGGRNVWPHTDLAEHMEHHKGVRRKHSAYGVLDKEHPSKITS